jgi:hypothetical protein
MSLFSHIAAKPVFYHGSHAQSQEARHA